MAEAKTKLVVGLGNPGREYRGTRHNVGFRVVECLAERLGASRARHRFHALVAEARWGDTKLLLVEPQTFMNQSGRCVRDVVGFYQLPLEDVLVVCDDLNLPTGRLRMRASGSHGGHNGLRDIIGRLETTDFPRLRLGIGSPRPGAAVDHVLSRFDKTEEPLIDDAVLRGADAVLVWAGSGVEACMNRFNSPSEQPTKLEASSKKGKAKGARPAPGDSVGG